MVYPIRFNSRRKGFSLVELIVVIGIFLIFIALSDSLYSNFGNTTNLQVITAGVVEAIRHAQANAQQVSGDSAWGVALTADQVVVFKGASYVGRDVVADQTLALPKGVTASGVTEIIFDKVTGWTSNFGTTTLANTSGTKNILINVKGIPTY